MPFAPLIAVWETTADNYLSHVSKDRILTVVTEAALPQTRAKQERVQEGGWALGGASAVRLTVAV